MTRPIATIRCLSSSHRPIDRPQPPISAQKVRICQTPSVTWMYDRTDQTPTTLGGIGADENRERLHVSLCCRHLGAALSVAGKEQAPREHEADGAHRMEHTRIHRTRRRSGNRHATISRDDDVVRQRDHRREAQAPAERRASTLEGDHGEEPADHKVPRAHRANERERTLIVEHDPVQRR
jgi:hypothetical protein